MKSAVFTFVLLFSCLANCQEPLPHGVRYEHLMIPMRDGVHLSAHAFFPEGDGPWPVLYEQRYADASGRGHQEAFADIAQYGFVIVCGNFRGSQKSEGVWIGYRSLSLGRYKDGYDAIEWLAGQSWSTGKIGTFGSSQAGYAQNFAAVSRPPSLVAQYMIDTGLSLYQEGYRIGGTTRPERFKGMDRVCRVPEHNQQLMREWFEHPTYDHYWKAEDTSRHFKKMNVPCMTIGSWYDFMNQGSIASYIGRQNHGGPRSRGSQKLLIGPWLHGRFNKGNQVGELTYPENAAVDMVKHMTNWFDYYLKDKDNGVDQWPIVEYYVMGATDEKSAPGNLWREAKDWPKTQDVAREPLFLAHAGKLQWELPDGKAEGTTEYVSNPRKPAEIPGTSFPGARDARGFEQQDSVLVFDTPILEKPLELTGEITAKLYVKSTAPDTDFIVRVSDVYPDGRSILIVDYIQRARYRNGFDKQVLLKENTVHRIDFHVGHLSQIFNAGHKIRVTVASTGSPLYEPNPQTGKPETIEFPTDAQSAMNTIYHTSKYPSHLLVPRVDTTYGSK
tara:strand:+ start:765 stop:2435 length:1671 start_codon:yes stop_codon:yes gene_type:complete